MYIMGFCIAIYVISTSLTESQSYYVDRSSRLHPSLLNWISSAMQMYPLKPAILSVLASISNSYITLQFLSVWQTLQFLQTLLSIINVDRYFTFMASLLI